jgi:hypothetical protein
MEESTMNTHYARAPSSDVSSAAIGSGMKPDGVAAEEQQKEFDRGKEMADVCLDTLYFSQS